MNQGSVRKDSLTNDARITQSSAPILFVRTLLLTNLAMTNSGVTIEKTSEGYTKRAEMSGTSP